MQWVSESGCETKKPDLFEVDASYSMKVYPERWETALNGVKRLFDGRRGARFIFWNSCQQSGTYAKGFYRHPIVVKDPNHLDALFAFAFEGITSYCCTHPEVGFGNDALPPQWILDTATIHYITDGDIGPRNKDVHGAKLRASINLLQGLDFQIHTVAPDFKADAESVYGSDVFELLKTSDMISLFDVYTSTGCHELLRKPRHFGPNVVRYDDRAFMPEQMANFVREVLPAEVKTCNAIQLAQRLTITLQDYLRLTKQQIEARTLVGMIAEHFEYPTMAFQLIYPPVTNNDTVTTVNLNANRFKAADQALKKDTASAIGLRNQGFFTLPLINGTILHGANRGSLTAYGPYQHAAFDAPERPIAILPLTMDSRDGQAIRQHVRYILKTELPHLVSNPYGDYVLYLCLAFILKAPPKVRPAFERLAHIMFEKTRRGSSQTEWNFLLQGNYPVPNSGRQAEFIGYMTQARTYLDLPDTFTSGQVWQLLCSFSPTLSDAQREHFEALPPAISITPFNMYHLGYEYHCPITCEDVKGGFIITPHGQCSPGFVLSTTEDINRCLICLQPCAFEPIGPKVKTLPPIPKLPRADGKREDFKHIVVLRGTVGAGKTTFRKQLVARLGPSNVVVCNTDDWTVKHGFPTKEAVKKVKALLQASKAPILIVDTCNERFNPNNIFGLKAGTAQVHKINVNYDEKNPEGYLAWSLRNVLQRAGIEECKAPPDYWLNPKDATLTTCLRVHKQKFKKIFKKVPYTDLSSFSTKESLLQELKPAADTFQPCSQEQLEDLMGRLQL